MSLYPCQKQESEHGIENEWQKLKGKILGIFTFFALLWTACFVFPHSPRLHDLSSYQAVSTMALPPTGWLQSLAHGNTDDTCCSSIPGRQVVADLWVTCDCCLTFQKLNHLFNQFPPLNSLYLKFLELFLFPDQILTDSGGKLTSVGD